MEGRKPFGKASLYLDKQAAWPHRANGYVKYMAQPYWADLSHDPNKGRISRMPCTSKLWQLEAMTHIPNHDTPP